MQVWEVVRCLAEAPTADMVDLISISKLSDLEAHSLIRCISAMDAAERQSPFSAELLCRLSCRLLRKPCGLSSSSSVYWQAVSLAALSGDCVETSETISVDGIEYHLQAEQGERSQAPLNGHCLSLSWHRCSAQAPPCCSDEAGMLAVSHAADIVPSLLHSCLAKHLRCQIGVPKRPTMALALSGRRSNTRMPQGCALATCPALRLLQATCAMA